MVETLMTAKIRRNHWPLLGRFKHALGWKLSTADRECWSGMAMGTVAVVLNLKR